MGDGVSVSWSYRLKYILVGGTLYWLQDHAGEIVNTASFVVQWIIANLGYFL